MQPEAQDEEIDSKEISSFESIKNEGKTYEITTELGTLIDLSLRWRMLWWVLRQIVV